MTGSATSDAVTEAMTTLARRAFLPPAQRAHADEDRPLPLIHGQTNSQPSTVAAMLRLLDVPPGASVLDIGSGSGWTTALLGRLVGPEGHVLGLEIDPDLATWGAENLAGWTMPWATIERADPAALGRRREHGWDRILVSAAGQQLPDTLVAQLADGGRMVLPVRSTMWLVERHGEQVARSPQGSYAFVPLR